MRESKQEATNVIVEIAEKTWRITNACKLNFIDFQKQYRKTIIMQLRV